VTDSVVIPCSRCRNPAVRLVPPAMEKEARALVSPLLKLASLKTGILIELPKNGASWFDVLASTPADLSTALKLECVFCAQLLEETPAGVSHDDAR
jgi:hypothetical protein